MILIGDTYPARREHLELQWCLPAPVARMGRDWTHLIWCPHACGPHLAAQVLASGGWVRTVPAEVVCTLVCTRRV